ncbi:hypothetical protein FEM03_12850 [Phragmitibacter flavus]|uniref:Uncharacterized protein n=1 Tax=Phragmitibacter flavus TaxID=2576071 RepID=A0A5R8KG74_9BACT|nr:hypothetical protein [Phragmitibacter flavus]TLD70599.1 hypothetical protein FEM03_12850 [Phragmitibacter flavus]
MSPACSRGIEMIAVFTEDAITAASIAANERSSCATTAPVIIAIKVIICKTRIPMIKQTPWPNDKKKTLRRQNI